MILIIRLYGYRYCNNIIFNIILDNKDNRIYIIDDYVIG